MLLSSWMRGREGGIKGRFSCSSAAKSQRQVKVCYAEWKLGVTQRLKVTKYIYSNTVLLENTLNKHISHNVQPLFKAGSGDLNIDSAKPSVSMAAASYHCTKPLPLKDSPIMHMLFAWLEVNRVNTTRIPKKNVWTLLHQLTCLPMGCSKPVMFEPSLLLPLSQLAWNLNLYMYLLVSLAWCLACMCFKKKRWVRQDESKLSMCAEKFGYVWSCTQIVQWTCL